MVYAHVATGAQLPSETPSTTKLPPSAPQGPSSLSRYPTSDRPRHDKRGRDDPPDAVPPEAPAAGIFGYHVRVIGVSRTDREQLTVEADPKFAVLAEKKAYERSLYLHSLSFGRLMDDVVVPYEAGDAFFVDGVSVDKKTLVRIKIVRQSPNFDHHFMQLPNFAAAPSSGKFVKASDYAVRLDVLFRGHTEDVTGQVINAFKVGVLPRLKEYMPKRDELLSAALTVFVEATKQLASGGAA